MMMTLTMRNEDCKNSDEDNDSGDDDDNDFYDVKMKLVTLVCLCLRRLDMIMALLIACPYGWAGWREGMVNLFNYW